MVQFYALFREFFLVRLIKTAQNSILQLPLPAEYASKLEKSLVAIAWNIHTHKRKWFNSTHNFSHFFMVKGRHTDIPTDGYFE